MYINNTIPNINRHGKFLAYAHTHPQNLRKATKPFIIGYSEIIEGEASDCAAAPERGRCMSALQEKAVRMILALSDDNTSFLIEVMERLMPQKAYIRDTADGPAKECVGDGACMHAFCRLGAARRDETWGTGRKTGRKRPLKGRFLPCILSQGGISEWYLYRIRWFS